VLAEDEGQRGGGMEEQVRTGSPCA
jgi:hypothetical protein